VSWKKTDDTYNCFLRTDVKNLSVMSAILLHDISIFFLTNIFSLATYKVL